MASVILQMHLLTYYQLLLVGTVAFARGGWLAWRRLGFTDGFRSALYLTAGTGVVQALLGGVLWLLGYRPNNILHLVYGLIVLIGIPFAFTYASGSQEMPYTRRDIAVLAFAAFAIIAAALRAYSTGIPHVP